MLVSPLLVVSNKCPPGGFLNNFSNLPELWKFLGYNIDWKK